MSSKSKNKGKSWEREVANYLTNQYNENFERVPHSGAFVGGKNYIRKQKLTEEQAKAFKGDIIPPTSWNHFNAECKSYADFPFHQLFQGHVKILETWLDQLMDAANEGDFNILFMKFNRKGTFVAVETTNQDIMTVRHINYGSVKHNHWYIMDMDTFFNLNSNQVKRLSL